MKIFDIPPDQRLKVVKVTPRKETHGKELVQAISMRLEWWPEDNSALNLLHPNLQDLVFWTPPEAAAQAELDGVAPVKKHRRVNTLAMPLKVDASFSGYQLTIEHGIDDSTALELYACALDKFEFEAKDGGAARMRWSLASNKQVTPQLVGLLCGLEGSTIVATLVPPTEQEQAIDGTTAAFQRDLSGDGLDEARQRDLLDAEAAERESGSWPFGQKPATVDGEAQADAATDAFLGIHSDAAGGPSDSDTDSGGAAPADDGGSDGDGSDTDMTAFEAGAKAAVKRGRRKTAAVME